jgi:hypothetical protein
VLGDRSYRSYETYEAYEAYETYETYETYGTYAGGELVYRLGRHLARRIASWTAC